MKQLFCLLLFSLLNGQPRQGNFIVEILSEQESSEDKLNVQCNIFLNIYVKNVGGNDREEIFKKQYVKIDGSKPCSEDYMRIYFTLIKDKEFQMESSGFTNTEKKASLKAV